MFVNLLIAVPIFIVADYLVRRHIARQSVHSVVTVLKEVSE